MQRLAELAAVANCAEVAQLATAAGLEECPLGLFGVLCGDVDHAVDRIAPPQSGSRAAVPFAPLAVLQPRILHVPEHPRVEGRIDRTAVDEHEKLVGSGAVEATRADGPPIGIDPGNLQV